MTQGQIGYLLETAIARVDPQVPTAALLTRVLVDPRRPRVRERRPSPSARSTTSPRRGGWPTSAAGTWRPTPAAAGAAWSRSPRPREVLGADHIARAARARHGSDRGRRRRDPRRRRRARSRRRAGRHRQGPLLGASSRSPSAPTCSSCSPACRGWRSTSARAGSASWRRSPSRMRCAGWRTASSRPGAWGPKIEAAGRFVAAGRGRAVITAAGHLAGTIDGTDGTWVVPDAGAVWA